MLAVSPDDYFDETRSNVVQFGTGGRVPRPSLTGVPEARRLHLGAVVADIRSFTSQRSVRITPSANLVHVIIPLMGGMTAVTSQGAYRVAPGSALLLGQRERTDCVWFAGAIGMVLHVSRAAVQAQTFAAFQEPRRLGNVTLLLDISEPGSSLEAATSPLVYIAGERANPSAGDAIVAGLVDVLRLSQADSGAFPIAASVKRAVDHLRRDSRMDCSPEQLARVAGVTLPVLRRNFKDCLGVTLTRFVLETRLDWARARLSSTCESRSIADLAVATGLTGAGVFTRAYQRKFGETPTQMRARTFATRR